MGKLKNLVSKFRVPLWLLFVLLVTCLSYLPVAFTVASTFANMVGVGGIVLSIYLLSEILQRLF